MCYLSLLPSAEREMSSRCVLGTVTSEAMRCWRKVSVVRDQGPQTMSFREIRSHFLPYSDEEM